MILVKYTDNSITITGHSEPAVCASVSAIMYTCVNVLLGYDENCIGFVDNGDTVEISFNKNTKLIKVVRDVFRSEINDLIETLEETNKRDCLSVEYNK